MKEKIQLYPNLHVQIPQTSLKTGWKTNKGIVVFY